MTHPIITHLEELSNSEDAQFKQKYFKTGPQEYAQGDVFLGIRNPVLHKLSKRYKAESLTDVLFLLAHEYHEARFLALLILVLQFEKADEAKQKEIFNIYLEHTEFINNWDLVDCSAYKIVGPFLMNKDRAVLYTLAHSPSLWERRIAMVATMHFIRSSQFDDTLKLAKQYLGDPEDLIHKATGWMLREMGKKDESALLHFLDENVINMPRTALRYAIEKLPKEQRQDYLSR